MRVIRLRCLSQRTGSGTGAMGEHTDYFFDPTMVAILMPHMNLENFVRRAGERSEIQRKHKTITGQRLRIYKHGKEV